jgi:hypothetical protein
MVVHLAVVGELMSAVLTRHRLRGARPGSDDREPPMHEQHTIGGVHPLAVGTAVRKRAAERRRKRRVEPRTRKTHHAGKAAHV